MISYIEEISSDVFIGEEIVTTDNHNQGLNTTLAGLMDKEANEFVKEPEVDMVEKPEDIARISRIMKNLLKTSNDNVQISNEKYVEITSFQAHAQNQLSEFQDKLEVATEEIALLKHTVARVDGNLTKLSSGMDAMTQKSDELSGSILDVVKDCNTSLKDYEDRLLCNEGSLKQVKEKAEKALADSRKPLSPPPKPLQALEDWVSHKGGILTLLIVVVPMVWISRLLWPVTSVGLTRDQIPGGNL